MIATVQQLWNAARVLTAQTARCNHGQRLCFPRGAERFSLRRCREKAREVCKSTQEVQRLLGVPASPERTSPGTALPEGGASLGNSSWQSPGSRDANYSQPVESSSKVSTTGKWPCPLPPSYGRSPTGISPDGEGVNWGRRPSVARSLDSGPQHSPAASQRLRVTAPTRTGCALPLRLRNTECFIGPASLPGRHAHLRHPPGPCPGPPLSGQVAGFSVLVETGA